MHSRGSSGALDRLVPAALRGRGYIVTAIGIALALTLFAVVAWFPYSSSTRTVHRAHVDPGPPVCPADCGVGPDARGQCANATCVCAPGWGNVNCNFSAVQLYGSTDIYKGFPKIEKDEQNWCVRRRAERTNTGVMHVAEGNVRRSGAGSWPPLPVRGLD